MIPFLVLVTGTLLFRLLGFAGIPYLANWQHALRAGLTVMFLVTASAHWGRKRPDLVRMVPPGVPSPGAMVTFTGVAEIAGAVGLLWQKSTPWAAGGLILLLIAIFPANVYASRHSMNIGGSKVTKLPLRAILQAVFLIATFAAGFRLPFFR